MARLPAGSTVNDACWRDNDVLAFSSSDHVHVCSFQKRKYLKQFGHSGGETYLGWSQDSELSMRCICPRLQLHHSFTLSWPHGNTVSLDVICQWMWQMVLMQHHCGLTVVCGPLYWYLRNTREALAVQASCWPLAAMTTWSRCGVQTGTRPCTP